MNNVNKFSTKVLHCNNRGKRNRGRQQKTWIDDIQKDLKIRNMDIMVAAEMTEDRRSGDILYNLIILFVY